MHHGEKFLGENMNAKILGTSYISKTKAGPTTKREAHAGLSLTSLVDAFTVILIYLLVAGSAGGVELKSSKGVQLPQASYSEVLNESAVVRLDKGRYFLNDKTISLDRLAEGLRQSKNKFSGMVIQADRRLQFSDLNPIVLSGLAAGYSKIQFAVMQKD